MKRGSKCIAQTINLSNPETCIRPKRIQKLVEAETIHPCPTYGGSTSTSYWTPRPVAIKICTRRDMERTCPPKLCDCPPKPPPVTVCQRICRAFLLLLKSTIAAGLIYWTNSEGLWGTSEDVEDLYLRIMTTIAPSFSDDYDEDNVHLPRVGNFKYQLIEKYNHAVFAIMDCIVNTSLKIQEQLRCILSSDEKKEEEEEDQKPSSSKDTDQIKRRK